MLTPPILWLGIIYFGSLLALLLQSFFSIDEYFRPDHQGIPARKTYWRPAAAGNPTSSCAPVTMAATVTIAAAIVAFPIAYFAARYATGKWKALFYLGVMLPLWSQGYCIKATAWKLILAKEGILTWLFAKLHLSWLLSTPGCRCP